MKGILTEPSPNRDVLGFSRAVFQYFNFLCSDYGFTVTDQSATLVRFESNDVFINVYHGRASYELGVEIGKFDDPSGTRYRLPTIIEAFMGNTVGQKGVFQASSPDAICSSIEHLAQLVSSYCSALLRGDDDAFDRVRKASKHISEELTEHYTRGVLRRRAEQAWQNKDYADVVRVYEKILHTLTSIERKRLEIARKHLA
ncbi:MAG: hypothetical protein USCGTAYLOR_01273 [Chromatiales bacterium USCg_Taylor]|nr:MAG: hypothetical protein USCGTAYLOR_01273 [Chromatiales bacterium USCg_Taylor]